VVAASSTVTRAEANSSTYGGRVDPDPLARTAEL